MVLIIRRTMPLGCRGNLLMMMVMMVIIGVHRRWWWWCRCSECRATTTTGTDIPKIEKASTYHRDWIFFFFVKRKIEGVVGWLSGRLYVSIYYVLYYNHEPIGVVGV
jgi:hypothetical protein